MSVNIGFVMDPIESITPYKDSTLAMMLAAQARGWNVFYLRQEDLYLLHGQAHASYQRIEVMDNNDEWYKVLDSGEGTLEKMQILLMRKDPPFNMDYIYTTYMLERAASAGVLVSNKPQSLRDVNEKLYTAWFSDQCPPTLVTTSSTRITQFLAEHSDIIVKPLDGMGGESIFRLRKGDPNINVILETITVRNQRQTMAQTFLPEIVDGDKRVLVVNGKPMPNALARIPAAGETRGNLAAGGRGVAVPLTDSDRAIVSAISDALVEKELLFVGVDIIGTRMTEINVTSPTCIRELEAHEPTGIAEKYLDALAGRLQ